MIAFRTLLQSSVQKDERAPQETDQEDDATSIAMRQDFNKELTEVGEQSLWSFLVVILMCAPGFCYILLYTTFAKISTSDFDTRCFISELENANWTFDQIRTISTPSNSNCSYYLYDYVTLRGMGYKKALEHIKTVRPPSVAKCTEFVHKSHDQYSLYQEFSLVCRQAVLEEVLSISPICGKIFASLFLVPLADLLGRKRLVNWGVRIFLAGGLVVALAPSFELLLFGRVLIGMAYTTMIHPIEAVVVEISSTDIRPLRFVAVNTGTALGYCIVPLIATRVWHWRTLQWAVCSCLLVLPLTAWLVPESPRWFLSKGRKSKAWATLRTLRDPVAQSDLLIDYRNDRRNYITEVHEHTDDLRRFRYSTLWFLTVLFAFVGAAYFKNYVGRIAITFIVTRQIYLILSGVVEMISYMVCFALLFLPSRKATLGISFFAGGVFYVLSSQLSLGTVESLVSILLTEIASGSIYTAARLYIAENVPTSHRCTISGFAEGMGAGISIIIMFNLYANFIADKIMFLVLGCMCFAGTIMSYFAYEYNEKDIFDTIREMRQFRR